MTGRSYQPRFAPLPAERFLGVHPIDTGTAELTRDPADPDGYLLTVNGVPSSYVHADPRRLDFEYMQWFASVLDALPAAGQPVGSERPPGLDPDATGPLRVSHVGGAGCTMARYLAATRPGSVQVVYELDARLVTLARQAFGLKALAGVRLRGQDGRAGLAGAPPHVADVVIRDAFTGDAVPGPLATAEWLDAVRGTLRPGGYYLANVADGTRLTSARQEAATARTRFDHVALLAEPAQLRGRRFGNVVLLASDTPLPAGALTRRLASGAVRARYVDPARVAELTSGTRPLRDADLAVTGAR